MIDATHRIVGKSVERNAKEKHITNCSHNHWGISILILLPFQNFLGFSYTFYPFNYSIDSYVIVFLSIF